MDELERYVCAVDRADRWGGLGGQDRRIVEGHLGTTLRTLVSMYCRVQVGSVPYWDVPEIRWRKAQELEALYRKRIDLVFKDDDGWWVVEVKPRACYMALGQVLYYTWLARREYETLRAARAMILTDRADDDLGGVCGTYDVRLVETPGLEVADMTELDSERG